MLASHCIIYPQDIVDPGTCTEFFLKNLISLTVLALKSVKILEKEVSMNVPECWFYALEITCFSCEMHDMSVLGYRLQWQWLQKQSFFFGS